MKLKIIEHKKRIIEATAEEGYQVRLAKEVESKIAQGINNTYKSKFVGANGFFILPNNGYLGKLDLFATSALKLEDTKISVSIVKYDGKINPSSLKDIPLVEFLNTKNHYIENIGAELISNIANIIPINKLQEGVLDNVKTFLKNTANKIMDSTENLVNKLNDKASLSAADKYDKETFKSIMENINQKLTEGIDEVLLKVNHNESSNIAVNSIIENDKSSIEITGNYIAAIQYGADPVTAGNLIVEKISNPFNEVIISSKSSLSNIGETVRTLGKALKITEMSKFTLPNETVKRSTTSKDQQKDDDKAKADQEREEKILKLPPYGQTIIKKFPKDIQDQILELPTVIFNGPASHLNSQEGIKRDKVYNDIKRKLKNQGRKSALDQYRNLITYYLHQEFNIDSSKNLSPVIIEKLRSDILSDSDGGFNRQLNEKLAAVLAYYSIYEEFSNKFIDVVAYSNLDTIVKNNYMKIDSSKNESLQTQLNKVSLNKLALFYVKKLFIDSKFSIADIVAIIQLWYNKNCSIKELQKIPKATFEKISSILPTATQPKHEALSNNLTEATPKHKLETVTYSNDIIRKIKTLIFVDENNEFRSATAIQNILKKLNIKDIEDFNDYTDTISKKQKAKKQTSGTEILTKVMKNGRNQDFKALAKYILDELPKDEQQQIFNELKRNYSSRNII